MILLEKILTTLATRQVPIAESVTVTVRALRARELDAIADVLVRPAPPMGQNPLAGSDAPPIAREDDLGHQRRLRQWFSDLTTAECAVAIDLGVSIDGAEPVVFDACEPTKRGVWIRAAIEKMRELTEPQIRLVRDTLHDLGTRQLVREALRVFVVQAGEQRGAGEEIEIPASYDTTEPGLLMAAAARFRVGDPFAWIDGLEPGKRAAILADELIHRRREEDRLMILIQAGRVAGL